MRSQYKRIIAVILLVVVAILIMNGAALAGESGAQGTWKQNNRGWWYESQDGTYPTDQWEKIGEKWYHFSNSGYMQHGWVKVDDRWYYLGSPSDDDSGAMRHGWFKDDDKWYYLGWPDNIDSGAMAIGWRQIDDRWYYFTSDGAMLRGWIYSGGAWYYLGRTDDIDSGAMATEWRKIDDEWYYFGSDGAMKHGWQEVDEEWYFLGQPDDEESGDMAVGLINTREASDVPKYYYFAEDGAWQSEYTGAYNNPVDGKHYYIENGAWLITSTITTSGGYDWIVTDGFAAKKLSADCGRNETVALINQATADAGWYPQVAGGSLSEDTLQTLTDDMMDIWNLGIDVGFVLVDINTGAIITGNPNTIFYAASTIKGPYVCAIAEKRSDTAPLYTSDIKTTIEVSGNDTYLSLRSAFGSDIMKEYMDECDVTEVPAYASWVDMRPSDLAKLWVRNYEFFTSGATNVSWVKPYFEVAWPSFILAELGEDYTVCAKPGWLYDGGKYTVYNDGGIVEKSGAPYILAILSNCYEGVHNDYLYKLVRDLDEAHSEMITGN
ncbi:MAG: hypothetical protein J5928_00730 [Firmicutes bacterium]|nr:hypothetical protein [Bacillota bacterium]